MKRLCRKCFFEFLIRLLITNSLVVLICWWVGWDHFYLFFSIWNFGLFFNYWVIRRLSNRKRTKKTNIGKH